MRLIALGLTVTLGFGIVSAYILWQERKRDLEAARAAATNLVQTLSSEIDRNLELYDLSLQAVADGVSLPGLWDLSPEMRDLVLFDRAATAKGMGSIFVVDKSGSVIIDSRSPTPPNANYANSEFFRVHEATKYGFSYLSGVWRTAEGDDVIGLTRRISAPDGSFAGVVVGTLRLSYLREIISKLRLSEKHTLVLLRENGDIIARDSIDDRLKGNMRSSAVFRRITPVPSGSFEEVAQSDGLPRLYVFEHIGEQSLILSYGQSLDAVYADWRYKAWRIGLLMLVLCAINITLVVFLARTLKRRADAEYQLTVMATTDSLTGLCNRRRLDEIFKAEWERAMRTQSPVALLMIDVDHFKPFNDRFGHQVGDAALVAIARCIIDSVGRASDTAARYGGEEFAVLLPGTTLADALDLAEEIRGRVMALRMDQLSQADATPTVSVGAAALVPRRDLLPSDLIKTADSALYRAKSKGRNCVEPSPNVVLTELISSAA